MITFLSFWNISHSFLQQIYIFSTSLRQLQSNGSFIFCLKRKTNNYYDLTAKFPLNTISLDLYCRFSLLNRLVVQLYSGMLVHFPHKRV